MSPSKPYAVITADSHAGASIEAYRGYLDATPEEVALPLAPEEFPKDSPSAAFL
jgi:hypothetical protein